MSGEELTLGILFICVGIPVISGTIVSLIHGPKEVRKEKKRRMKMEHEKYSEAEKEMLEEIYYGLSDLGKRVSNLETILYDKEERSDG